MPKAAMDRAKAYPFPTRSCGTLLATFLPPEALHPPAGMWVSERSGAVVFSCDYNGWADVPEEEREGIDAFEAAPVPPRAALKVTLALARLLPASLASLRRKAA